MSEVKPWSKMTLSEQMSSLRRTRVIHQVKLSRLETASCGVSNATISSLIALKTNDLEACNTIKMNDLTIQLSPNATMTSFLKWLHLVAFDTTSEQRLSWL